LRKICFFSHIIWKGVKEGYTIKGKCYVKRRRGKPLTPWASDILKLVGGHLADAVHQAVD